MKVTILMNSEMGLPVARQFNLHMLRTGRAYQNGPAELVMQGKYKGKRKPSAFRKSVDRVVIVEGWYEPKSAFNNKGEGTSEWACFQDCSVGKMLKECNGARILMEYKDRTIEKLEEMPGVSIDCDALMPLKGRNEALEKAKANPNSFYNRVQAEVERINNASS